MLELSSCSEAIHSLYDKTDAIHIVEFEIRSRYDLHDGIDFKRFLFEIGNRTRVKILYAPSHLSL